MRYKARAPLRIDFAGGWTDVPLYAQEHGGAVLSAAITRYVHGYIARPSGSGPLAALRGDRSYVHYELDLPAGAGLGSSAAQTVLWATLVKTTIANTSERREIAEIAWSIGNLLGILGGRQDEYASALGGINFLTFGQSVVAERLAVDPGFVEKLRSHLVLVYTGESRFSSAIHEAVWERYRNGNASVISALHELTGLAGATRDAIIARNLENFASLISQNWTQQQILDPSVTTTAMQSILDFSTKNGALGGKACGAGGGGCLLLVAAPDQAERLRSALQKRKVEIIDFDFDTYGVFLTKG